MNRDADIGLSVMYGMGGEYIGFDKKE